MDDASLTGSAAEVHFDGSLKGPISAISAPNLTVLGQTVITDADTVFDSLAGSIAVLMEEQSCADTLIYTQEEFHAMMERGGWFADTLRIEPRWVFGRDGEPGHPAEAAGAGRFTSS